MSALSDLADGVQALAEAVRAFGQDPGDAVRLLALLAVTRPAEATGEDRVGLAQAAAQRASGALCRRAALAALARATAASTPPCYEDAVALRIQVCGLLEAEEVLAADGGDDASALALRDLRTAVADDLTRRAADLARLGTVRVAEPLPALVHAYRLYQDLSRADEISLHADAEDPNFIGGEFQVRGE